MTTDYRANQVSKNFAILEGGTIVDIESGVKYDVFELIGEIEFYKTYSRNKDKEIEELKKDLKSQKGLTDLYSTIAGTNATKMSIEKATRHQICMKIREFVELNEDWGTILVCQIYEFLKELEKGE